MILTFACVAVQESNHSELGRLLFKQSFTHVAHFTGTGRFSSCESGQDLVAILSTMRAGETMSDDLWNALAARRIDPSQPLSSQQCLQHLHMYWGTMAWEQTARLQQLRAWQEARALGKKLYFLQAVDQAVVGTLTAEQAKQALQVLNMGNTGYLMGMCPLYIGMPVRTSANTEDVVLTRELPCTVRRIELHPLEVLPDSTPQCVVLKYLPLGVLVECEDPEYRGYSSPAGDAPPGHFWIRPLTTAQPWTLTLYEDKQKQVIKLKRRQAGVAFRNLSNGL